MNADSKKEDDDFFASEGMTREEFYEQYITKYDPVAESKTGTKNDESMFSPDMIKHVRNSLRTKDQVIMRDTGHKNKLLFVYNGKQNPYCPNCKNSLSIKKETGYLKSFYTGICDKCPSYITNKWQVGFITK